MASLPFKLGMFINELRLPLPEALDVAADLGVDYVWFSSLLDRPPVAELTDAELDEIDGMVRARGRQHMIVSAGAPFKKIDLVALEADSLAADEEPVRMIGDYAYVTDVAAFEETTLEHALPVKRTAETTEGVYFEFGWKGDEITGICPNTDFFPFYPTLEGCDRANESAA